MKNFLLGFILLVSGVVVAGPELQIVGQKFDFGLVPQNSTLVRELWFKSVGDDTLRITGIKTGCSCAVMEHDRDWVAPGDSMKLRFVWDVKRLIGSAGKYPRVLHNGPTSPDKIWFNSMVAVNPDSLPNITIVPYRLELVSINDNSHDSVGFIITNKMSETLTHILLTNPVKEYEIFFPDSIPALSTASGYIKLNPEYSQTEFKHTVTLQFNDPKDTRISLPIRRKIY